jgi:hypothetical protein
VKAHDVAPADLPIVATPSANGTKPADGGWPERLEEAAFHGPAGTFVEKILPHSEADPAALRGQYLAAAGNLFGAGAYHSVEADQHPARLWVAIVGATSKARKGSSWSRVRSVAAEVEPSWAERIAGGLASGEGPLWAVRDPIYKTVKKKGTNPLDDDEWVEELADPGVSDKRLLVVENELARVFDVIARSGSTLSATLRSLWDGGTVSSLSKNAPFKSTHPHLSAIGHITAEELRMRLADGEIWNGLANRLILIAARRSKLLPHGSEVDPDVLARLQGSLIHSVREAHRRPGRIGWSDKASKRWAKIYEELSSERPGLLGAVLARAEAQTVRLSVCYALLDTSERIEVPHLEAALAVWRYAERSAQWVFADATGDSTVDSIREALRNAGEKGVSRTEMRDMFGRNMSVHEIERGLGFLLFKGWARRESIETGGRPEERWFAV